MPRKFQTEEEKKEWGRKMAEARAKKKLEKETEPEVVIYSNSGTQSSVPEFITNIINDYFPGKEVKVNYRDQDSKYEIEIVMGETKKETPLESEEEAKLEGREKRRIRTVIEKDVRGFVVDKVVAQIEIQKWCEKIKANMGGKVESGPATIEKSLPKGLDPEFFFKA